MLVAIACGVIYMCISNRKAIVTELAYKPVTVRRKKNTHNIRTYGSQDEADIYLCGDDDHLLSQQMPLLKECNKPLPPPQSVHSYCGSCGLHMPGGNHNASCKHCGVDFDNSYVLVS
eukprot:gene24157-30470_t